MFFLDSWWHQGLFIQWGGGKVIFFITLVTLTSILFFLHSFSPSSFLVNFLILSLSVESDFYFLSRLTVKFAFSLPSVLLSLFNFNWSSFTNKYLVLNLSCITLLSNWHSLPNNKWPACIGTTSHKTSSLYLPKSKMKTYLFTFTLQYSFNY